MLAIAPVQLSDDPPLLLCFRIYIKLQQNTALTSRTEGSQLSMGSPAGMAVYDAQELLLIS
jgi:hypothetical protein